MKAIRLPTYEVDIINAHKIQTPNSNWRGKVFGNLLKDWFSKDLIILIIVPITSKSKERKKVYDIIMTIKIYKKN